MIIECASCESKVDGIERGEVDLGIELFGAPSKAVLLECPVCKSPLLGFTELIQVGNDEWDWCNPERQWPPTDDAVDAEIPAIAKVSLVEAKVCFKARAFSACAVMCGRTLEGVCKDHDPKTKTLASGLKKLKADGTIDSRLFEWGEALRKHRNFGAHATTAKLSKEDARDLLDFSVAICEYIYVLNSKFQRFQQRQAKDET